MKNLNMLGFLSLLYLLCCVSCCIEHLYYKGTGPIVKTNSGAVAGKNINIFNTDVAVFLGIPFAAPPLGEKRYMKPEPVKPWDTVLEAHEKPRPCMQYTTRNITLSVPTKYLVYHSAPNEDCLYLNVWSPNCCCNKERRLPVLVRIYGGGFSSGSSDALLYDGSTIAAKGEVVIVTFNYRVGSFGFLYAGTDEAPGNAGMHDQVMALKWVKDNIHAFGGDPDSVTLFGESAGSISNSLHLISPLSRGLFHRAILQSGSSYGVQFVDNPAESRMKTGMLALLTGCAFPGNDSEVISCLKHTDALKIAKLEAVMTDAFPIMFTILNEAIFTPFTIFTPMFNEEFLPKSPKEAYDSGDIAPVEVLAGLNKNEASIFLHYNMPKLFPYDAEPQLKLATVRNILKEMFKLLPQPAPDAIWKFYFEDISDQDSPAMVRAIRESYGDYTVNCPVLFLMEKLDNAYLYWMTHRSLKNSLPEWVGVTHFDELPYVFGVPINDTDYFTAEDGKFSEDLIRKWASFASTGHPMNKNQSSWPKFDSSNPIAYELNPQGYKSLPFPKKETCEFWGSWLLA